MGSSELFTMLLPGSGGRPCISWKDERLYAASIGSSVERCDSQDLAWGLKFENVYHQPGSCLDQA